MGAVTLNVLSRAEMEKVHQRSLDILQRVGVRVQDAECRRMLAKAGAKVDSAADVVCLPAEMVDECLAQAPSDFMLHRRDGKVIRVEGRSRGYGSLVIDPWIIDYETRLPRRPVLDDVVRHTRLGDALETVDFLYRMDFPPADVPGPTACLKTMEAFAVNTTKHMLAAPASMSSMHDWLELADIFADGTSASGCPFITFSAPVTTPLTFDGLNADIMKTAIRKGAALTAQTEPIAGTTAPLTFAGGLLMGNCENVFLVVMSQLIRPGTPIFYSVGNALTDLSTGRAIFYNADKMLWKIASSQMADFYGLPMEGETTGSLTGRYDVQCGIEYALLMLPTLTCGRGLYNGLGSCYNACGMSAEFIVIQADMVALLERISKGIDTGDQMLGCESIASVGPGGHFLEDDLTIKMLRSGEFFTAGSFDRLGEQSPNRQEDSMLTRAHQRVAELLDGHTPAVDPKVAEQVRRWATKKAERSQAGP